MRRVWNFYRARHVRPLWRNVMRHTNRDKAYPMKSPPLSYVEREERRIVLQQRRQDQEAEVARRRKEARWRGL